MFALNVIRYKDNILSELKKALIGILAAENTVFVGVDGHGAYTYSKPDASELWDEGDIASLSPLSPDFIIPLSALEILIAETQDLETIEALIPLQDMSISEFRNTLPGFDDLQREIIEMVCDYAQIDFERVIFEFAGRQNLTISDFSDAVFDRPLDDERSLSLITTFLFEKGYLQEGIALDVLSLDSSISSICKSLPGKTDYQEWASRLDLDTGLSS